MVWDRSLCSGLLSHGRQHPRLNKRREVSERSVGRGQRQQRSDREIKENLEGECLLSEVVWQNSHNFLGREATLRLEASRHEIHQQYEQTKRTQQQRRRETDQRQLTRF